MKKLFMILFCCMAFISPSSLLAEAIEPSETGNYFEEKIMPYIVAGGSAAALSLTSFVGLVRDWRKKSKKVTDSVGAATTALDAKMDTAVAEIQKKSDQITETKTAIDTQLSGMSKSVTLLQTETKKTMEDLTSENAKLVATVNSFKDDMTKIKDDQARTMKAIVIGLGNHPDLCAKGFSTEILKIAEESNVEKAAEAQN